MGQNKKLLLIEDDVDLCQSWEELFDLLMYKVYTCNCGRDALLKEKVLAETDVLITDYYLPDMNGAEVIRQARTIVPHLPAILLTGSREPFIRESARRLGNCVLINKPTNIETLEDAIHSLLNQSDPLTENAKQIFHLPQISL